MGNKLIVDSRDIYELNAEIIEMLKGGPVSVQVKSHGKRSMSQNSLSWVWYGEISRWLRSIGDQYSYATTDWVHEAMKHTFLGYEDVTMVDVITKERAATSRLRGTSNLDVGSFKLYLDLVYNWALSKGLLLTIPEDSEYRKLCNMENGLDD